MPTVHRQQTECLILKRHSQKLISSRSHSFAIWYSTTVILNLHHAILHTRQQFLRNTCLLLKLFARCSQNRGHRATDRTKCRCLMPTLPVSTSRVLLNS